jgi:hypothetical protein
MREFHMEWWIAAYVFGLITAFSAGYSLGYDVMKARTKELLKNDDRYEVS